MENLNKRTSQVIANQYGSLAEAIVARQYEEQPELYTRLAEAGRTDYLADVKFHLSYLSEAIAAGSDSLFGDYVAWAKVMQVGRNMPVSDFALNLRCMCEVLAEKLPQEVSSLANRYIQVGLEQLKELPSEVPSAMKVENPLVSLAEAYLAALLEGQRYVASTLVLDAVESGVSVKDIYLHVFQRSQHEIGRLWQMNQISVAQEHYCTAATQLIMSQLYPYIFSSERNGYTMIVTCVAQELHEIGARMIADFFEMDGWDTFYLGANMPSPSIVGEIVKREIDLVAISVTLTSHIGAVSDLIAAVRAEERCQQVKIIVGGYPFNVEPKLWQQVGADGCGRNAEQAIRLANQLMNQE